jgi:hypothetical protein
MSFGLSCQYCQMFLKKHGMMLPYMYKEYKHLTEEEQLKLLAICRRRHNYFHAFEQISNDKDLVPMIIKKITDMPIQKPYGNLYYIDGQCDICAQIELSNSRKDLKTSHNNGHESNVLKNKLQAIELLKKFDNSDKATDVNVIRFLKEHSTMTEKEEMKRFPTHFCKDG